MARRTINQRFIKHTSIKIGDLIRVHFSFHDMDSTRVGVVAKRDSSTGPTEYMTPKGVTLFTVFRDGTTDIGVKRITWLAGGMLGKASEPSDEVSLFDLEEEEE